MSYFVVHDWMITKLKLKGLERDVFAIIYGFSPKKNTGVFNGSLDYLAEATGCSKVRVCCALAELVEKKLISKRQTFKGSVKYCEYKTHTDTVNKMLTDDIQNVNGTVNKMLTDHIQNVNGTVNKMLTNNISDSIVDNKDDSIEIGEGEKNPSHSQTTSTQNNSNTQTKSNTDTNNTSEYLDFENAIISYAQTCGKMVSSISQCLQGEPHVRFERENQIRRAFEYRRYDWRHSIENAKRHTQKNTRDVRFRFHNFLERVIQNLNHGDGSSIPVYKNEKVLEIEKQNKQALNNFSSNSFIDKLKQNTVEVK